MWLIINFIGFMMEHPYILIGLTVVLYTFGIVCLAKLLRDALSE